MKTAFLEKMDPLDRWVQEVNLVKGEEQDFQELLVVVVMMAVLEQLANLDPQALPDRLDFQVLLDLRVKLVLLVPQAPVGLLGQEENLVPKGSPVVLALLALEDVMETQEQKVYQALLACLAPLD